MLQLSSRSAGIGIPNVGTLFSASGTVTVMFNTTRRTQTFIDPGRHFDAAAQAGRPVDDRRSSRPRRCPTARVNPTAPPGGEVYIAATIDGAR